MKYNNRKINWYEYVLQKLSLSGVFSTKGAGYVERFSVPAGCPHVESFSVENRMKKDPFGEINDPYRGICGRILCLDNSSLCLTD